MDDKGWYPLGNATPPRPENGDNAKLDAIYDAAVACFTVHPWDGEPTPPGKISLIKFVRLIAGFGLKDAKDYVESRAPYQR